MPIKLEDLFVICSTPDIHFLKYLQHIKFMNSEQFCPKCKKNMALVSSSSSVDKYRLSCRNGGKINPHSVKRSIRYGSWFESSKLTIPNIVFMTYMWVNQYSISQVTHELNISSSIVTDWFKFFRDVCEEIGLKKFQPIGGPKKIVEINACKVEKEISGRKKYKEQCIFSGVERGSDKCFFIAVPDSSALNFLQVIKNNVLPGTTIYSNLSEDDCVETEGFNDLNIYFSGKFGNSETNFNTNKCKSAWGHVKRKLASEIFSNEVTFSGFLSEYVYRKTFLENAEDRFLTFVADIASVFY